MTHDQPKTRHPWKSIRHHWTSRLGKTTSTLWLCSRKFDPDHVKGNQTYMYFIKIKKTIQNLVFWRLRKTCTHKCWHASAMWKGSSWEDENHCLRWRGLFAFSLAAKLPLVFEVWDIKTNCLYENQLTNCRLLHEILLLPMPPANLLQAKRLWMFCRKPSRRKPLFRGGQDCLANTVATNNSMMFHVLISHLLAPFAI